MMSGGRSSNRSTDNFKERLLRTEVPSLAGDSPPLRSRPAPARCRSARRNVHRLAGTLLTRIPEINQECPPAAWNPRIAPGPRPTGSVAVPGPCTG